MVLLLAPMGRLMAQKNAEKPTDNTAKHIIMWVDATANFQTFSHPDSIDYYVRKLHLLGFTDLVVDVRPVSGEVLFNTSLAPKLQTWKQFTRPDFDYLGRFITIAHAFGMKVHAALIAVLFTPNMPNGLPFNTRLPGDCPLHSRKRSMLRWSIPWQRAIFPT